MKMRLLCTAWLRCLVCLASIFVLAGCESEDSPDTSELDNYFKNNPFLSDPRSSGAVRDIVLTPESAEVSHPGQQIHFEGSGGRSPYTWDVSNPSKGSIRSVGRNEAIYTATVVAPNDVIVYDQRGHAGVATINGPLSPLIATANPSTLATNSAMSICTASRGVPPYTWEVADDALGVFKDGASTGNPIFYKRNAMGGSGQNNIITVTDSEGNKYSLVITHQ